MKKWTGNTIRKTWLDYFVKNNHYLYPSQSLIPHNDPSLLWINSGVATLKKYFSGEETPLSKRLTSSQRSIRTNDIFNIGVTSRHHTFFEMLGNFSIGDYFKKEAIKFAYDLLVNHYFMDVNKLYFTVYEKDNDAYDEWINLGINKSHIIKCNKERNFWDVGSGPCGPCTEIYYDRGEKFDPSKKGEELFYKDIENDRYVEIWNIVFSQFNNNGKNEYTELARKNIDTGAGLERLASVLQNTPTNYDTDLFLPIIKTIEKYSKSHKYDINAYFSKDKTQKEINRNFIIIADHIKACVFAIADGAIPSAKDKGSILRKLLRRAIICSKNIEASEDFLTKTIDTIIKTMNDFYPYLNKNRQTIIDVILQEQKLFNQTLSKGYELYKKALVNNSSVHAETIFKLTDTYGFPFEVIKNLCDQNNIKFDIEKYKETVIKHQQISHGNKHTKAMTQQNKNLINFHDKSIFTYDEFSLNGSKIIAIFDENFNPINNLDDGKCWLVFDKTCFYATSGGQEHDIGKISHYDVMDVIKAPNGQHLHLIETKKQIKIGDQLDLQININNRKLTSCNHSCEHLLQKAFQSSVSELIHQEGAYKSAKKVTFDFSYPSKLSDEQLIKVEDKVNEYIKSNAKVTTKLMSLEDAKKMHAQAHFENVYKKINGLLRVVIMDKVTSEICGGTHVKNLKELEQFMFIKLDTKGSGSYRIEGITTNNTINNFLNEKINQIKNEIDNLIEKLNELKVDSKLYDKEIKSLSFIKTRQNYHELVKNFANVKSNLKKLIAKANLDKNINLSIKLKQSFIINDDKKIITAELENIDAKIVINTLNQLANKNNEKTFIAFNLIGNKVRYFIITGSEVIDKQYTANTLVAKLNKLFDGSGGGSLIFAQGGCEKLNYQQNIKKLDLF